MRVLVVENDDEVRATVCRMLQTAGIEIAIAVSAQSARDHLAAGNCDVVLSALLLRGKESGLEVADEARRRNIRCIIMSGSADRKAEIEAKGVRFLAKPFSLATLLAAVRPDG